MNLGRESAVLTYEGDTIMLGSVKVNLKELQNMIKGREDSIFFITTSGSILRLAFSRSGKFYKLKALGENIAPTLEISGIHMHNILNTDPWSDAERKVKLVGVKKGFKVLDICTGLGYTAIHLARKGAEVISIEKDPNVIEIAEYNPWSWELTRPEITLLLSDAFYLLDRLPVGEFDAAIHDPPRFSLAGNLYSLDFYVKLHRVLRRGALVYHYTGAPGKYRGLNFQASIVERLRLAGFRIVDVFENDGVVAEAS
ncbi:MAG: hypothetical protein QW291_04560 [Thermofilaceae archaeon]